MVAGINDNSIVVGGPQQLVLVDTIGLHYEKVTVCGQSILLLLIIMNAWSVLLCCCFALNEGFIIRLFLIVGHCKNCNRLNIIRRMEGLSKHYPTP